MQKKNYNKSFNRYEVKDKTSKFVKEKLPAYVLAIMMVFWTVASVLGIVAFFNRDNKESALNVINASADEVQSGFALRDFDIPLYGLAGFTIYEEDRYTLEACPYLVIRNKQVWVVPQYAYYYYIYENEPLGSSITAVNGAIGMGSLETYQFLNTDATDINKTIVCYALTPFNNDSAQAYDYFYPAEVKYTLNFAEWNDVYIDFEIEIQLDFVRNNSVVDSTYFRFIWSNQGYNLDDDLSPSIELPFFGIDYDIPPISANNFMLGQINPAQDVLAKQWYTQNDLFYKWQDVLGDLSSLRGAYDGLLYDYNAKVEELRVVNITLADLRVLNQSLQEENTTLAEQLADMEEYAIDLEQEIETMRNRLNAEYENGKRAGYVNGYDVGYAEGALNANSYTFDGLLSSVFDVPVRVFKSLFNFELLGVNLANFFLSLLTLAIIIFIVRWIL